MQKWRWIKLDKLMGKRRTSYPLVLRSSLIPTNRRQLRHQYRDLVPCGDCVPLFRKKPNAENDFGRKADYKDE